MRYPIRICDDGSIAFTKKTKMADMAEIEIAIREWVANNEREADYGAALIKMLFKGDNNVLDL